MFFLEWIFPKKSITPYWGYQWGIPGGKVEVVGVPGEYAKIWGKTYWEIQGWGGG